MSKKLSEADIDRIITTSTMHRVSARTTLCVLTLANGFEVLGQSACVDPAEYDQKKGEHWAYQNARSKVWELEGYRLREALYAADNVLGATPATKGTVTDGTTPRLDDVPLMLHRLADSIESGAEQISRVVVIGHSGGVNAGVQVYGFGADVAGGGREMCELAVDWFNEQQERAYR